MYSQASEALDQFARRTGIPVTETQADKGSLPYDHPQNLGAVGVTGTPGANILARDADLVIAVGTRLSDFTTASKTAFQNPKVRFINITVTEMDASKHTGLPLAADARVALLELAAALEGYRVSDEYSASISLFKQRWEEETDRLFNLRHGPPISQGEVIGAVNRSSRPQDVVVCAAGSLPGDLHKLWRTRQPGGYHLEYGYSSMGYEIAGGLGVKIADPSREVYVMVGDGSYLMMSSEIVTSIQEGCKLTIILLDNHGFSSIGGLSQSIGSNGFGTDYRYRRPESGQLDGDVLPVDFALNAAGLGARAIRAVTREDLERALEEARGESRTTVIVVEVDKEMRVPGYESWWDVAVAEVSEMESVQRARAQYEKAREKERDLPSILLRRPSANAQTALRRAPEPFVPWVRNSCLALVIAATPAPARTTFPTITSFRWQRESSRAGQSMETSTTSPRSRSCQVVKSTPPELMSMVRPLPTLSSFPCRTL
jgi:3D-(3,5/4)-trihydroxycyclohexane-1,2-dione acylhydrolase (decyclizing)